jgi:Protein of unknown function (DUF1097)
MTARIKATLPLAIAIGILAYAWTQFSLNFTFHWFAVEDLGNGLGLPGNFHLVLPAAFVSWGFFFAAGADNAALRKVAVASVTGGLAALVTMALSSATAGFPDFWGIALWVGVFAVVLVLLSVAGDWHYIPATFGAFASVFFWWLATGIDSWFKNGGGIGNSAKALGDPATAGGGGFGGVLSTPYVWVWVNISASLLCGCALGFASVKLAALLGPLFNSDRTVAEPAIEPA